MAGETGFFFINESRPRWSLVLLKQPVLNGGELLSIDFEKCSKSLKSIDEISEDLNITGCFVNNPGGEKNL